MWRGKAKVGMEGKDGDVRQWLGWKAKIGRKGKGRQRLGGKAKVGKEGKYWEGSQM